MVKCYAQEKRVFDINKVTVVGSPTISDDGVASGFSSSNYVKVPTTFNKPFKLSIPFITGNSITGSTAQYILLSNNKALQIFFSAIGNLVIKAGTTAWGVDILSSTNTTLKTNTSYILELEFTGTQYKITLNNDLLTTVTSSSLILEETESAIGSYPNYEQSFKGSIDLTAFKIYVDGELAYSPTKPTYLLERRKEGFDLSKFTVVGSPTITSNGVASGFSNSTSYIKVSNIPFSTNWKINFTAHYNKVTSNQVSLGIVNSSNNKYILRLWYRGNANDAQIVPYYDNGATFQAGTYGVTDNTTYKYEIWNDGVNVNYKIINADTGLSIKENILSAGDYTLGNINANIFIGVNNTLGDYFAGSIDLKQFSITVDGEEVFTGAKEKFYAMEGGF